MKLPKIHAPSWLCAASSLFGLICGGGFLLGQAVSMVQGTSSVQQMRELGSIQATLREIDSYVTLQKKNLMALDRDLDERRREKEILEKAATIDRDKVKALLASQAELQSRERLDSIIIAFVVSFISSLAATAITLILRGRSKPKDSNHNKGEH